MAIDISKLSGEPKAIYKPSQIVIYGKNGMGKSSLGAPGEFGEGAKNPVYMNTNNRINHLAVAGNDMPLHTYDDCTDFLKFLLSGEHNFKTLFIDTADDLELIISNKVAEDHSVSNIENVDFGKGYGDLLDLWKKFLTMFSLLRDKRGMTIVILAQIDKKTHNPPGKEPYDIWVPKVHGKTNKGDTVLSHLTAWADVVIPLVREEYTKVDTSGFQIKTAPKKYKIASVGDLQFITKGAAEYFTKDTFNLPERIDASYNGWKNLQDGINGYWQNKKKNGELEFKHVTTHQPTQHSVTVE
jgi:hypothetical protein